MNPMNTAYAQANAMPPPSTQNGLMQLADAVSMAAKRVDAVASQLHSIGMGLHGPRPEKVSDIPRNPEADNLAARMRSLSDSIDNLEQQLGAVLG